MKNFNEPEQKVLRGEISVLDYICKVTDEDAKNDLTGFAAVNAEAAYWRMVRDAHKNGKTLVAFGGGVPVELIYAMDCIPLYVDLIPIALTKSAELTAKFIYEADVHINSALCSHSKSMLGAVLFGSSGFEPDAFVRTPIACPSSSTALNAYETRVTIPAFAFDPPTRCSERTMRLCSFQIAQFIDFLERLTGSKLDLKKLRQRMEQTNHSKLLLEQCAIMRRIKPCPMSSHILELGKLMAVLAPTEEMARLLQKELDTCKTLAETGTSPCPGGEKHRVFMLQTPLWCGNSIIRWLELEYGAVTVMDGLGYERGELYERMDTLEDCCFELARVLLYPPLIHGAATPAQRIVELAEGVMRDYDVDVCMFLGSVGCRHTWAVSKMLTDSLRDKFGVSTLFTDVDSVDAKYKDENQIKAQIGEFMDTVIHGK